MNEAVRNCEDGSILQLSETPELLCSGFDRPEKDIAVRAHKSVWNPLSYELLQHLTLS